MPIQQITSGVLADGAVIATDIADGIITGPKLGANSVSSNNIVSVLGSAITANTVANSAFQTGSVETYMRANTLDFGMRNRIINGAMLINQRGSSITSAGYTLDRWNLYVINGSKLTAAQGSSSNPVGFPQALLITSTTALSVGTSDYYYLGQYIEGFNTADLAFGTANAKAVTLSFWVRSSLTGTFGGSIQNGAENRSYPFTYTIVAANTWEQKSVTIPGDTTGTWIGATNGVGMRVGFGLAHGSDYQGTANTWVGGYKFPTGAVNLLATNGATFYLTGVQLEEGSQQTSFEYRMYGTEMALCQRYYSEWPESSQMAGYTASATEIVGTVSLPVRLRATPSVSSGGGSKYGWYDTNYNSSSSNTVSMGTSVISSIYPIVQGGFGGLPDLSSRILQSDTAYKFSAEL
jgi:hypothetical protein